MIIKNVELGIIYGVTSKLPENVHSEPVFAGKFSVGESPSVNALMNRKPYAGASFQPGKVQTASFYHINDALYYMDLPGCGYAKVTLVAKEKWGKMMGNHPQKSLMLKMVFLLVDIRYELLISDEMIYGWIVHNGYRPVVVAAKPDKINRSQIRKHVKMLRTGLGMEKGNVLIPSFAEAKQGREEIWELIEGQMAD